jgi:hypothetical protein
VRGAESGVPVRRRAPAPHLVEAAESETKSCEIKSALASEGLGLTLVSGNGVTASYDGLLLRPDPPVSRHLSIYTRVRPDPITEAFVSPITEKTPATPSHIQLRLKMENQLKTGTFLAFDRFHLLNSP